MNDRLARAALVVVATAIAVALVSLLLVKEPLEEQTVPSRVDIVPEADPATATRSLEREADGDPGTGAAEPAESGRLPNDTARAEDPEKEDPLARRSPPRAPVVGEPGLHVFVANADGDWTESTVRLRGERSIRARRSTPTEPATFRGLPVGDYRLIAEAYGHRAFEQILRVTGPDSELVHVVQLEPTWLLEVTALDEEGNPLRVARPPVWRSEPPSRRVGRGFVSVPPEPRIGARGFTARDLQVLREERRGGLSAPKDPLDTGGLHVIAVPSAPLGLVRPPRSFDPERGRRMAEHWELQIDEDPPVTVCLMLGTAVLASETLDERVAKVALRVSREAANRQL